jgi:cell division protein FtsI/penicillin-binding protein 2
VTVTVRKLLPRFSVSASYTTSDNVGKNGLEKYYESYLRGIPGKVSTTKNRSTDTTQTVLIESKSGYNLVLNIDAKLQKAVYNALEKSIKNIGSKKGAAVAWQDTWYLAESSA